MKRILDEVLRRSSRLDALVDGLATRTLRGERVLTPAELLSGMLTAIERGISIAPEGPIFPYNRIVIDLKVESAERKAEIRGALLKAEVTAAVTRHLERQCRLPGDLRVDLRIKESEVAATTYEIDFRTVRAREADDQAPLPETARLTRVNADAVMLAEGMFNIGRVAEVHGRDGRLVRRNQIVLDGEGSSRTVSRAHARIEGTREDGAMLFLVFDDGSRHGSTVVRNGRAYKVHRGTIGMRLQDGDEVYFGDVRLDFRLQRSGN